MQVQRCLEAPTVELGYSSIFFVVQVVNIVLCCSYDMQEVIILSHIAVRTVKQESRRGHGLDLEAWK